MAALRTTLQQADADEARALQLEQSRAHGVAWAATYVRALQQMLAWAQRLQSAGRLGELEALLLRAAFAEYLAQLSGGLPMSQGEFFRAESLDPDGSRARRLRRRCRGAAPACRRLRAGGAAAHRRAAERGRGHAPLRRPRLRRCRAVRGARAVRALRRRPCGRRARLAPAQCADPRRGHRRDGAAGRVRPDHRRGAWRLGHGQVGDVRRHRGAGARLHRAGLAGHAHRDRRRADRAQRHAGAEGTAAAADRQRRADPHRQLHRARRRLGPGLDPHPRREGRRRLAHPRQQDLDHARRAQRPDDADGAHRRAGAPATAGCRCSWPKSRAAAMPSPSPPQA